MLDRILLALHNLLRWVILISLLYAIVKSYAVMKSKGTFSAGNRKAALIMLISAHTTLLIGLFQWLFGRYGIISTSLPAGVDLMKNKFYRFFWIEHPFGMIVAITLITIGYSTIKKGTAQAGLGKKAFWLLLIALLVLLATIPWPGRVEIGRPLIPGV
jgi:cytochrome bd-type quinol oxidase subunit 2